MTQTNQTYIEEKAQEIVEISQGHFVDYEWIDEDGTKGFSKAIPISFYKKWLRVALQDAIKYGEEIAIEELKKLRKEIDTVEIKRYGIPQGIEIVDSPYNRQAQVHNAILDDILAKLTTSQEEKI